MTSSATRSLLAAVAVLGVGATAACSGTTEQASAADEKNLEPTTLTFKLDTKDGEFDPIDLGKKGESIGDRHIAAFTLLADGEPAGRMHTDCLVVDDAYEGQMCTMVAMVAGGTLTFQNAGLHKELDGVDGDGRLAAVTGGTGKYAGARGEVDLGQEEDGPLTITLLP